MKPAPATAASAALLDLEAADSAGRQSGVGADGAAPTAGPRSRGAELLRGLNPQQRAAVVHQGSPLLIIAGAGSGKTRVLTHRVGYLLAERGAAPSEVLAITFTNKAAAEMKHRVAALIGPRANAMWVSTFHSMCVRILRAQAKHLGCNPCRYIIQDIQR